MNVWQFINSKLAAEQEAMLLCVLESEGSSPGRGGFKMAVAADGTLCGTIGGGVMEYKLVEMAKAMLAQKEYKVLLMQQHHDKEHIANQSGMICSGSQLNAFIPLTVHDKCIIEQIMTGNKKTISISSGGLNVVDKTATGIQYKPGEDWIYTEPVNRQPLIHIIGGGHVGLALSELMNFLGFYIKLYDDRPALNTIKANLFAHESNIVNYDCIARHFTEVENDYVVIATVGYRTDKIVLKQLLGKSFCYLGLLGSRYKVETLFKELREEGVRDELLRNVFSPVGIDINSKTTKEIAVSIAAEVIREKNKAI